MKIERAIETLNHTRRKKMAWGTKNPPKKEGRYLITYIFGHSRQVRQADRYEYPKGNWLWHLLPSGTASDKEVVAWQKCPEPYKEEENE
jgi:hypothetical protein